MKHEWERFLNLLKLASRNQDHYLEVVGSLKTGCTEEQFKLLEKELGVKLPSDYKESLMIYNGQSNDDYGIFHFDRYLSNEDIVNEWEENAFHDEDEDIEEDDRTEGVKPVWWNKKWIPIATDGSGNCFCIDLDPDTGGRSGQIIKFWHDDSTRRIVAQNFTEFFKDYTAKFLEEVKKGKVFN